MKTILILVTFSFLICACNMKNSRPIIQKDFKIDDRKDSILENLIINQTINSLLDSIDGQIMLNLSHDTTLYKCINYHDTLLAQRYTYNEYQNISFLHGISFDTIEKTSHIKLNILLNKSIKGKEFKSVSTLTELHDLSQKYNSHYVFLGFNRVVLNKEKDMGFFNIDLSCSYNAGVEYTALVKKVNDRWTISRLAETAIR